jgi:senataxin
MERLKAVAQLDEGQERALRQTTELAFTRHEGFVLVQGPPGTGKTTTLLGLLNVLHNGATQDHFQAVLDRTKATAGPAASAAAAAAAAASAGGAATHAPHSIDALSAAVAGLTGAYASAPSNAAGGPLLAAPPRGGRILVCAHSNCAIDELVTRILQRKPPFIDEYGNPYAPSIARVGSRGADVLCSLDKRVADREAAVRHAIQAAGGEAQLRRNTTVLLHSLTQEVARHAAHCAFIHEHAAHAALAPTAATCATCGWAAAGASLPHSEFALCFASSLEGQIIHLTEAAQEQHALIRAIGCLPAASRRDDDRAAMRQLRALVLDECHIVFCTMSAAAESLVSEVDGGFEVVLLDEAAQASELASLVPMAHGARLVGLVGDPMQLPATVLSHRARELGFGRSLFERLQRAGHPVLMLQTQYRMHGAIRAFPSVHFYGSQLKDSESIARMMSRPPGAPGGPPALFKPMRSHSTVRSHSSRRRPDLRCAPYAFFNLQNGAQERGGEGLETSLLNRGEAALCVALIFALRRAARAAAPAATSSAQPGVPSAEPGEPCKHRGKEAANGGSQCKWGSLCGRMVVLTPYNAQRDEIRRLLNLLGRGIGLPADGVEVSSVDAYQGREADVVIFSCVRAGSGPLGFVKDARRLNVALTRARHALYIIGSEEALRRGSPDWHALLDDARRRALCCEVEASSLRQVLRQADEAGYRKLGDYLMHLLPYTLLDGCRDGLRAPSPPDGMLVELLPQPGRPEGGQPVIPRWLG